MNLVRAIARPFLAAIFFEGARSALINPGPPAAKAKPLIDKLGGLIPALPGDEETVVRLNAAAQIGLGAMLATGRLSRLAAIGLIGTLIPTTIAGHAFGSADEDVKKIQRLQFAKNLSIVGGLLLAAVDTGGKPGIAWRLQHLSKPGWFPER